MMDSNAVLVPEHGWHCLHLYYRIEYGAWQLLSPDEQRQAKAGLSELVRDVRAFESTQLLTFSVVTPKADVGFMLVAPDLHAANRIEKQLTLSLGAEVLVPVYSYLSLTEESEYATANEEDDQTLETEDSVNPGSSEFDKARHRHERIYPTLPDWPVVCFYQMSMRRGEGRNWYTLPYAERRRMMGGYGKVGREFAGKIKQLITGSSGLDDGEWGVTLFAHDTAQIKASVYQMRFNEVSAVYEDLGEFYVGLQLPLDELFRRLQL